MRSPVIALAFVTLIVVTARAAEVIPPKPDRYFNDYAGVVSQSAALRLNQQLAQFERETSDQVVVAVFPKMQSDSDVADYAQRVAQAWQVGQKGRRNGVVLFAFIQDRKISIQVGYGLEGILPDIVAYDIRANGISPYFRKGEYEQGLAVGIDLICKAIRGEYKGSGKTVAEQHRGGGAMGLFYFVFFFIVFVVVLSMIAALTRRVGGYGYSSRGGGPTFFPMSGGGGGWSSGNGGGGGFDGFSGGGGSFGGGGSSGSW